jgi:hypothetical protein
MAIDMIENNELGALSESRMIGFADDDDRYAYSTRKSRAKERAEGTMKAYAIDPSQATNCDYLQARLTQIQNELQAELKKNPNKWERKAKIDPRLSSEAIYKTAIANAKCEEKKAKEEEDKFKKETEQAIQRASESSPPIPQVQVAKGSRTTKIVLIGVGLLVVSVVAIKLLKRN